MKNAFMTKMHEKTSANHEISLKTKTVNVFQTLAANDFCVFVNI